MSGLVIICTLLMFAVLASLNYIIYLQDRNLELRKRTVRLVDKRGDDSKLIQVLKKELLATDYPEEELEEL